MALKRRCYSFVFGGIGGAICLAIGSFAWTKFGDYIDFIIWAVIGIGIFSLVSCWILDNNFVGDVVSEIFQWGFVKFPGLIFTLDLDEIIWLLSVKLLFWIIGMILAILAGILAITVGAIISIFVYPYAIYKNITGADEEL